MPEVAATIFEEEPLYTPVLFHTPFTAAVGMENIDLKTSNLMANKGEYQSVKEYGVYQLPILNLFVVLSTH